MVELIKLVGKSLENVVYIFFVGLVYYICDRIKDAA